MKRIMYANYAMLQLINAWNVRMEYFVRAVLQNIF